MARTDGENAARPVNPDKPAIPDLTHRTDEIGELADSLSAMTRALYDRMHNARSETDKKRLRYLLEIFAIAFPVEERPAA